MTPNQIQRRSRKLLMNHLIKLLYYFTKPTFTSFCEVHRRFDSDEHVDLIFVLLKNITITQYYYQWSLLVHIYNQHIYNSILYFFVDLRHNQCDFHVTQTQSPILKLCGSNFKTRINMKIQILDLEISKFSRAVES